HYLSPTMPVIFVSDDTPTPPPYPLSLHDALPISSSNIQVFFNEPVTVDSSSFTVVCDGNPQTFQVSGSGTDTITLDPDSDLPTANCTVTAVAANNSDVDGRDPPDHPAANSSFSFATQDAAPSVTSTSPAERPEHAPGT